MANKNVSSSQTHGTQAKGNSAPYANMPANNSTNYPVKLGSGQSSKFAKSSGGGVSSSSQSGSAKGNLPTHNGPSKKVNLGHTKHGVGQVPGYLKGK